MTGRAFTGQTRYAARACTLTSAECIRGLGEAFLFAISRSTSRVSLDPLPRMAFHPFIVESSNSPDGAAHDPRMGSSSSRPAVVRDAIPHPGLIGLAQDISKEADLPWWSLRPSAPPSLRRGRFAGSRRNSETRHTPLRHRWPRTRDRAPGISSPGSDRSPGRCAEARSSRARPSTREPSGSP
jgi:hypothetical protein